MEKLLTVSSELADHGRPRAPLYLSNYSSDPWRRETERKKESETTVRPFITYLIYPYIYVSSSLFPLQWHSVVLRLEMKSTELMLADRDAVM